MVLSKEVDAGLFATIGFGGKYNQLCRLVTEDDMTEDESQLPTIPDQSTLLLIQIGPSACRKADPVYYKRLDRQILVEPKMFRQAVREVSIKSDEILPSVIAGISMNIAPRHDLYFTKIKTCLYGKTPEGEVVVIAPQAYASMQSIAGLSKEDLVAALNLSASQFKANDSIELYWFSLGLTESDAVKRFLFFYLAIEASLDKAFEVAKNQSKAERLGISLDVEELRVLDRMISGVGRKSIVDKFVLTRKLLLSSLTLEDVVEFKRMHKARTDLAHGKVKELPSIKNASAACRLASRLLSAIDAST